MFISAKALYKYTMVEPIFDDQQERMCRQKHNAISQSAVSCAILQFFADLCKQRENRLVIKIYYPFGHNIYGGKTNETCVGPKMLSSYSRLKTNTNSKHSEQLGIFLSVEMWRISFEENIFPFYQL